MITVVSWNIDGRLQAVEELLAMDADVALLQEVGLGALETLKAAGGNVAVSPQDPWEPWTREHYGSWSMVVKLSDRVGVQWFRQVLPTTPQEGDDEIAVSNVGIIAAAQVIPITGGEPFIAVSMYARSGPIRRSEVRTSTPPRRPTTSFPTRFHVGRRQILPCQYLVQAMLRCYEVVVGLDAYPVPNHRAVAFSGHVLIDAHRVGPAVAALQLHRQVLGHQLQERNEF